MTIKNKLKLSAAIFCNSASQGDSGKVNCRGVFTNFLAWAYPTAIRTWHSVLTLYNLPTGTTTINVSISFGRGKKTTLASPDIEQSKEDLIGSVINIPLRYRFQKEGLYTVHFNVVGSTIGIKVPLRVTTQPWPRFTKKQLAFLNNTPSTPRSFRVNIQCSACSRPYVFEESVLPEEKLADNVYRFPDSGVFECESCGHRLHLSDIQGQMRSSIKSAVSAAMRGGS